MSEANGFFLRMRIIRIWWGRESPEARKLSGLVGWASRAGALELGAVALRCVLRGGKEGKSCLQPEAGIPQEARSRAGAQGGLDDASAGEVVAARGSEDCREAGGGFGHGRCSGRC